MPARTRQGRRRAAAAVGPRALVSPLASWFADEAALRRFRGRVLGRRPALLPPRDRAWRTIAPGFEECVAMAASGLPFQIAADRRYDRRGDPGRLGAALRTGKTVYLPQIHQVLPRVARLMVALRATLLGPAREECSFLFLVEGVGRPGMGLHHDGEVDALWLQLEGRRTVTIGPAVPGGTPEDLPEAWARGGRRAGWRTLDLGPGTLFHLPPRTPHAVVCRGLSLAVTLTWRRAPRPPAPARALREHVRWDVVSGFAEPVPGASRRWLWTQVPVVAEPGAGAGGVRLRTPEAGLLLPPVLAAWVPRLQSMPRLARGPAVRAGLDVLVDAGVLGPRDLPRRIRPDDPARLDGWRFA